MEFFGFLKITNTSKSAFYLKENLVFYILSFVENKFLKEER
jgi:hypothetical protein